MYPYVAFATRDRGVEAEREQEDVVGRRRGVRLPGVAPPPSAQRRAFVVVHGNPGRPTLRDRTGGQCRLPAIDVMARDDHGRRSGLPSRSRSSTGASLASGSASVFWSPTTTIVSSSEVEVLARHAVHVVLGDRGDLLRVVVDVAVGQPVHRQLRELAATCGARREACRERLDDLVLGARQLGVGHVGVADGVDLFQDLGDRVGGVRGDELAARRERSRRLAGVERRARAVGPALALAQVEIQAIEPAAQDQVHHRDRDVVGVGALDADQADADRRLRGRRPCR